MSSPTVLILGGNRYNVRSIEAARRAGFRTIVADRNPAAPGLAAANVGLAIDLIDCDALQAAVAEVGGIAGVVSMAEAGVVPAAELSKRLGLASISVEAAKSATSKLAMRRAWSALGSWSPAFAVAVDEEEAVREAGRLGSLPLIFKPDRSFGGSRGVRRVDEASQIGAAFQFAKAAALGGSGVVVERCVVGSEHSAEVLIWQGQAAVLCIGEKVKSAPPYRVDLSVQYPASLTSAQNAIVAEMCQAAVRALGLTQGIAHVEFAWTPEGPVLFELGARCGGGHTPLIAAHVSGVDEFVESCRMACGLEPTELAPRARQGGDYRFVVLPPGELKAIAVPSSLREHPEILDAAVTFGPGDSVDALRTTSDRAGFVVALAGDRAAAVRAADWACDQIVVSYVDGRSARPLKLPTAYSVLDPEDVAKVVRGYQKRITAHGPTLASLNSGSAAKQAIRHEVHASALRGDRPKILDVGCGLGLFYRYLQEHGRASEYTGYDVVPDYVRVCQESFPEAAFQCRNIFDEGIEGAYDTIVFSQVLNNRYSGSDNWEVMKTALRLSFARARCSVSIDMMSTYVDFQNPELYYYAPEEVFRFAKSIAPRVVLRHDYRPFEFCVQMFQPDAPGFVP